MWVPIIVAAVAVLWFGAGFIAAGYTFAYAQREFPELAELDLKDDRMFALGVIPTGLAGLMAIYQTKSYIHGWLNPLRK